VAINNNYLCVYDLETTGFDPKTVYPIEVAAVILHPRKLTIVEGGNFWSRCRPPDYEASLSNLELWNFHAKANNKSVDEIKQLVADAPPVSAVWGNFANFLASYHADSTKRRSKFSAPIRCGHNIFKYDNIIFDRMCKEYGQSDKEGEQNICHPRDTIDLLNICTLFFSNQVEPQKYTLEVLRAYFGMKLDGAHTALCDVEDTSKILAKFINYFWEIAKRTKFQGALAEIL